MKYKNENSQNTKEIIRKLFKYILPYKYYLISALILSVITVAFTLLTPILLGNGIDLIISKGNVDFAGLKAIIFKNNCCCRYNCDITMAYEFMHKQAHLLHCS